VVLAYKCGGVRDGEAIVQGVMSLDSVDEYAQRAYARYTLLMHSTRSTLGVPYGVRRLALSSGVGVLQYVYRRAEIPSHAVGLGRR
jgi:hypothetical protein